MVGFFGRSSAVTSAPTTAMTSALFTTTAILYAIACVLYLVLLVRGNPTTKKLANGLLAVALVSHVAFLVAEVVTLSPMALVGIYPLLSLLALGIAAAFLLATLRYDITVLGAFIAPVGLMLFLASGLGRSFATVPQEVESAMLSLHVGANVLGLVAFALAFGAAIGYVIQERMLRRRQLGGVFQRLPALEVLDSLSFRWVAIGFPLLTFGMVTGTFWILRASAEDVSVAQAFGLATWAIFATVILLRVGAGWRGRRAALGTIMGFISAMIVLVGYAFRAVVGA